MKIQANELRIGNYLYYEGTTQVAKVQLLNDPNVVGCRDEYGSFTPNAKHEPIPLTEEILLKCGFTLNKENTLFEIGDSGLRLMNIGNLYFRANFPIKPDIVHLHQLQNLYFALTGKELEVKL